MKLPGALLDFAKLIGIVKLNKILHSKMETIDSLGDRFREQQLSRLLSKVALPLSKHGFANLLCLFAELPDACLHSSFMALVTLVTDIHQQAQIAIQISQHATELLVGLNSGCDKIFHL